MKKAFKVFCGVTFALAISLGQSTAAVIVSNINDAGGGSGTIYASGPPQEYAQQFVTGSQSVQLADIIVDLGASSGTYTASAVLVSNNSGLPGGTVLSSFAVPTISSTYSDLTLLPTSTVTLSANTAYWLVLSATGTSTTASYKWEYTDTNSSSFPYYASSQNNGASWTQYSDGPFLLEADSTATVSSTPEPASMVLVGLAGLIGFSVLVARRLGAI